MRSPPAHRVPGSLEPFEGDGRTGTVAQESGTVTGRDVDASSPDAGTCPRFACPSRGGRRPSRLQLDQPRPNLLDIRTGLVSGGHVT